MTEEEKERLRLEKDNVSNYLLDYDNSRFRLNDIDERLQLYVDDVSQNPLKHNLWEQLSVRRFFSLTDKYGLRVGSIKVFNSFYESLSFPGLTGRTSYRLTPVQVFQYANIYGFWDNGRRLIREAVLFVPRKYSKTTSSAAPILYDLFFGDANAECYTAANSNDQAKKCFDVIRSCVRDFDPRENKYTVNEEMIKSKRKDRSAFAQCLTANAKTKDGLCASTIVMDEFSQARDATLLNVLTSSMGIRKNPLTLIITTASDVFEGPFFEMLKGYKDILIGDYEDDTVFAHLFEPDIDDEEDSELTWRKVQPHMGITVDEDFYRKEYKAAQRNGSEAILAFRTKQLNIYADNGAKSWISSTIARKNSLKFRLTDLPNKPPVMVGIDLSESNDLSALCFAAYIAPEKKYYFYTLYFFAEGALPGNANENLFRRWAEKGHLILTKGSVIDYRTIVECVVEHSKKLSILRIGYDPWKSTELINMLASVGGMGVMQSIRQTNAYFTAPVESFEHGMKTGHIVLNDNPINAYCFGNAVLDIDRMDNMKPVKRQETGKIDGVIAMLECQRLFIDYKR